CRPSKKDSKRSKPYYRPNRIDSKKNDCWLACEHWGLIPRSSLADPRRSARILPTFPDSKLDRTQLFIWLFIGLVIPDPGRYLLPFKHRVAMPRLFPMSPVIRRIRLERAKKGSRERIGHPL